MKKYPIFIALHVLMYTGNRYSQTRLLIFLFFLF